MIFNLGGPIRRLPVLNSGYPANVTEATVGTSATFKAVIAEAGIPDKYTYQWYVNGSAVSGATSASYTRSNLALGTYTVYCMVTNEAGTVQSRTATLKVTKCYLFQSGTGFKNGLTGFTADNSDGSVSTSSSLITLTIKTNNSAEYISSKETINASAYSKIIFTGVTASFSGASGYYQEARLYLGEAYSQIGTGISGGSGTFLSDGTVSIDLSGITSGKVRGYFSSSDSDTVTCIIKITNIYLEV